MSKPAKNIQRPSSWKLRRLALVTILVVVFALGTTAAVSRRAGQKYQSPPSPQVTTTDTHRNLDYRAGAPIPIDPQTGQVRPLTQAEAQKLAADIKELVNQSTDGLQSVRRADGSVSMDLEGRFQSVAVAKLDAKGNLVQSCVDNREAAAVFFGIDPQLVGVKKRSNAPVPSQAAPEGEDR